MSASINNYDGLIMQNSGALPAPGAMAAPKEEAWWKKGPNVNMGGPKPPNDEEPKSLLDQMIDFVTGAEAKK